MHGLVVQVVVVGGGAGGVELSLALHHRLGTDCPAAGHQVKYVPNCLPSYVQFWRLFLALVKQ